VLFFHNTSIDILRWKLNKLTARKDAPTGA
jgi:hypothetical protein